ncbi:MAG TPA: hypothetical protein VFZ16_19450 [Hyphomicrobiaceae bacterium]|nr:hypothetical protein [Hyphomicrobiaceae bacterium]
MRYILALLAVAVLAVGCTSLSLPLPGVGVGSGVPMTCGERLTESSCGEGQRCRWVNDSVRADGTYATAHCTSTE